MSGLMPAQGRLHGLDFARGLACLSMPIYHSIFNLYAVGLTPTLWTKATFWVIYQKLGLGTFVLVSGMAFVISTRKGIRWPRLTARLARLMLIAAMISLVTYLLMPDKYVRFGVLHFFSATIIFALLVKPLRHWLLLPGLLIVGVGIWIGKGGVWPELWLYPTGLMSQRPSSIDYIPLVPWLGVFLLGMGLAQWLNVPATHQPPPTWMKPVIWLGKHSLAFYLIHQPIIYGVLLMIASLVKG